METVIKAIVEAKIPTIILIGLILFTGAYILINSKESTILLAIGGGVLLIGLVLSIISFTDYRNKEYIDSIVQHYRTALDSISKTHSLIENKTQSSIEKESEKIGSESNGYTFRRQSETTTI